MAKAPTPQKEVKTGKWVCRSMETYKGVTWRCTGGSRKGKAEAKQRWQANYEAKIAEINGEQDKRAGKITLKKAMTDWYDLYMRGKVTGGRKRSERTIQTDICTMGQIFDALGNINACDIDSDRLQRYFNDLAASGLADSTIHKRWILLGQFFSWQNPRNNPMALCSKPHSERIVAIDDDLSQKTAYTDDEMYKLTQALAAMDDSTVQHRRAQMLIVIMWQFLRVGEAIELRAKDVDIERGIIHIRRQYDERHKIVVYPKDNSRRDVAISQQCRHILAAACGDKRPDDLLFTGNQNGHDRRMLRSATLDTLTAACKAAGVARHTVHDLRHDGISYLVRHGVKAQTIQRWAGHADLTVTLDVYYRDTGVDDAGDKSIMTGCAGMGTAQIQMMMASLAAELQARGVQMPA